VREIGAHNKSTSVHIYIYLISPWSEIILAQKVTTDFHTVRRDLNAEIEDDAFLSPFHPALAYITIRR
jgi:hypothetical protein